MTSYPRARAVGIGSVALGWALLRGGFGGDVSFFGWIPMALGGLLLLLSLLPPPPLRSPARRSPSHKAPTSWDRFLDWADDMRHRISDLMGTAFYEPVRDDRDAAWLRRVTFIELALFAMLVALILLTSCALLGPERAVTVELRVMTASGAPVSSALVVVKNVADNTEVGTWLGGQNSIGPDDGSKRTNPGGKASFHDIAKGKVFVLVDAAGHTQYCEVFRLKQGLGTYVKQVQLTPWSPDD